MKRVLVRPNIAKNCATDKCTWCFQVSGPEILYTEFFFAVCNKKKLLVCLFVTAQE